MSGDDVGLTPIRPIHAFPYIAMDLSTGKYTHRICLAASELDFLRQLDAWNRTSAGTRQFWTPLADAPV